MSRDGEWDAMEGRGGVTVNAERGKSRLSKECLI